MKRKVGGVSVHGRSVRRAFAGVMALAVGVGGAAAVWSARDAARAQAPLPYASSTYNTSGLPGFRLSVQPNLIAPSSPDLATVYGAPSSPTAAAPSARITTLARSLEHDPDRIYQFVRNGIAFEPQFGLHKGADGVLLDGAGGAFDQAQLMVELLRASNVSARYVLGTVSLGPEASSILRVDGARQACELLAVAGTPATVNGSTDCASLSGAVTAVSMTHLWVEAEIGGVWYAFDPALKRNDKIAGIDLWAAAGTTASGAWSNVSSGVGVSGDDLNGVNPASLTAKLTAYTTALQTNLIANHSDKSLEELAGGWRLVRDETAPRVTTLPNASAFARWTGDVPSVYRAKLTLQTAGFVHEFDLPSIYGWRTQAQLQDRILMVAVRKREHLNASATAYFTDPCDGVTVVCGSDPGATAFDAQNRRLDLSINHPYAGRRTGLDTNGQPWGLGTFADETVTKSIEMGKRVEILVRTAGGDGDRRAVWAAATDPIQQHRIVPAGNPYECTSRPPPNPPSAEDCDGTQASSWDYWLQDTPFGNGPFARGESAVGEMNTRKDGLLNLWTDLFDRTVGLVEPLSGARIFHQHSVGVALTPSYVENVLDIDTAVGISAGGSDAPHHILSALAALASSGEALALGQSATERPAYPVAGSKANAGYLMARANMKVLTTPGSTASLPAAVLADTRAEIERYLARGFSVTATTTPTGPETAVPNAFLARRNDGSEYAWIIRSQAPAISEPDVDRRPAFRKGAETTSAPPNPLDYLGRAEGRALAANVAGAHLGAVDLRSGTLSFSEGTELSVGQGEFPYSLSFSRSYSSTGPVEGGRTLGMGWTHNWETSVGWSTDTAALTPDASGISAAPLLISALVALQAGRADTMQAAVTAGVALDWLQEAMARNTVNVRAGGSSAQFHRLANGTLYNPVSPTETLTPIGTGSELLEQFDWTLADRSVMRIRNLSAPANAIVRKSALTTWEFPTGMVVTLTYAGADPTNPAHLIRVSNNLGAELTFEHRTNPTETSTTSCFANAAQMPYGGGRREAEQDCHEAAQIGGRLVAVRGGGAALLLGYAETCPRNVNFCASRLVQASRTGQRTRYYDYVQPIGGLQSASSLVDYQLALSAIRDEGVTAPRAQFTWKAVGGQVAPYVEESFDAQGRKTTYYASTFTHSAARDATNAVVRQVYDKDGRLIRSADAMGRTSEAAYDGLGRTRVIKTPWGDRSAFTYDARGNLIQTTRQPIEGCTGGVHWCQTITVKAEYHPVWNKPTRITLPATFDGQPEDQWTVQYNGQGLVEEIKAPRVENGYTRAMEHSVWRTWYDDYGRVVRTQDPTGVESSQVWGGGGLPAFCLRQTTLSSQSGGVAGLTTNMLCDAVGNITSVTDPRGHATTAIYDTLRRKTSETGPAGTGLQTQWVYDLNGDMTEERRWDSAAGVWRTTTTTYSATHKPLTVTDPAGDVSRVCYDAVDRPTTTIDGERRAALTVYNAAGQPVEVHRFQRAAAASCEVFTELPSGAGFTETRWRRYEYNAGGLQSAEIDARGNRMELVYDGLGRRIVTQYPDGAQTHHLHNERDQNVYVKTRSGDAFHMTFDAQGRPYHRLEANWSLAPFAGRNSRTGFDLAGRPLWRDISTQPTVTFDEALVRDIHVYGYDAAGRVISDQWRPEGAGGISLTTGYGYDAASNRTSIVWPDSWTATYGYDAVNRIQTVSFPGSGGTVTISHDSLSRRTGMDRPGAAADTTYAYEADSDLASMGHTFAGGTGPGAVSFAYAYDAAARTTSIAINQPAFEWMPSLAYARSYGAANALNQISSQDGAAVTWNADGNMTSDGVTTFTWEYGNRMSGASRPGMTATYAYDAEDRRTRKTVNGVVTRMLWSGSDELGQYSDAGSVIRRFVPDGTGGMDARLATVANTGDVYWHHTDRQGSVIATSDSNGQTVGVATYSPHGEFGDGQSAPPQHSPFGYTGREFDPETGLYQYRARYYSPRLGQFLSMDPIGSQDDPNLYMYVGNDPVNLTDPTGMQCAGGDGVAACRTSQMGDGSRERAIRQEGERRAAEPVGNGVVAFLIGAVAFLDGPQPGPADAAAAGLAKTYFTYTRTNRATRQVYTGRTSGRGTADDVVARRGRSGDHRRLTEEGFDRPVVDRAGSRDAIRGREQQLIEANGGAQSTGGTSANRINGISPRNPQRERYMQRAREEFGD